MSRYPASRGCQPDVAFAVRLTESPFDRNRAYIKVLFDTFDVADLGKVSLLGLLDLSDAFDTVDHDNTPLAARELVRDRWHGSAVDQLVPDEPHSGGRVPRSDVSLHRYDTVFLGGPF